MAALALLRAALAPAGVRAAEAPPPEKEAKAAKEAEAARGTPYREEVDPKDIVKSQPSKEGYAGVEACKGCHAEAYRAWEAP